MMIQALSRLLVLCLLACSSAAFADTQRPKIGLVLGGGGAAGTAHVGVLKVLEENNIQVDMIAGTSMGAIVGSLYASGLKAAEIEKIVNTLDWPELFNDQVSRRDQNFHIKQEMSSFFDSFKVGADRTGIKLPRGAVKGQRLTFELRRLLDHVSHIQNFDRLPIPFRAVATDIENGQAVILNQGNLSTAVRASMSIPGLFPPIEINGRLLVDGFVSNNIPVNVAQQMGADILIVVGIPTEYKKKKELGSAVDIALQSMNLMMAKSSTPQLQNIQQPHIIIQPPMDEIGSLNFERVKDAMLLGERQARLQLPELLALTKGLRGLNRSQNVVNPINEPFNGVIDHITIENSSVLKDEILIERLGLKAGDALSLKQLQKGLDAIYALGYFEVVDYQLLPTEGNRYQLIVNAQKDPIGDRTLRGGFSFSDDFNGNATYQAGLEYTMKGLNSLGGEAKTSLIIGDSLATTAEFYQPLNKYSGSFWNLSTDYQERDVFVYEPDSSIRSAEARVAESGIQLDFGREIDNTSEARVGVFYRNLDPTLKTGAIEFPADHFNLAGLSFEYHEDTLNDRNFPDEGIWKDVTLDFGISALGSDDDYTRLDIQLGKAWKKDKHHFVASASAGTTFADDTIITERFELGGFARLSGLEDGQLIGNHYAHGMLSYYYDIFGYSKLANVNAGILLEAGNTWTEAGDIDPGDLLLSGAAFIGANTLIGPAYMGVGITENYDPRYFLQFGRAF